LPNRAIEVRLMLSRAIVCPPCSRFARGLTSVDLGVPDLGLALVQHERYCAALEQCGLEVIRLEPREDFPDSTFIEDTAVLVPGCAILTRPGAPSRSGEVAFVEPVLRERFASVQRIEAPGCVDAGDVCQVGERFFIGISERSNEAGAQQLAALLGARGFATTLVDIRHVPGILHLKTGITSLGDNRITLIDTLAGLEAFRDYDVVRMHPRENYAANCLRINDHLVISAGFPRFESAVRAFGYPVIALDMSEFRKMDGALTCLSLRF
jgi:dimethylargininase